MTKIKFCGITNYEDAKEALDLGVDALGFNFYQQSSRFISPLDAQAIIRKLPPTVWHVGVFVNATKEEVVKTARLTGIDTLQFHGTEDLAYCQGWKEWRVMKAVRVSEATKIEEVEEFSKHVEVLLFDSFSEASFGGTGKTIPSSLLSSLQKRALFTKAFLSGGLTVENVFLQITQIKPFGVDVASGIEERPGRKSRELMRGFVEAVRLAGAKAV